ncbi:MAG: TolC family protein [Oligoflexia bacterium]|nr:TolC family protein [Oligoflexia bacterium]
MKKNAYSILSILFLSLFLFLFFTINTFDTVNAVSIANANTNTNTDTDDPDIKLKLTSLVTGISKNWNPNDTLFIGEIPCTAKKCVSVAEAVTDAVNNGFTSREKFESVFRARQNVFLKFSNLLPKIDFNVGYNIYPVNIFSIVSNLVGFLLPTNWFEWGESILFYEAEKSSYLGLLQDQVSNTEVLYYNIHRLRFDTLIYAYYIKQLQDFITSLKQNTSTNSNNKVSERDILLLENFLALIKTEDTTIQDAINEVDEYELATAMAYPKIDEVGIKPIVLPDLMNINEYEFTSEELARVKERSTELLAMRYLMRASEYAKFARAFSFLGGSDGTGSESGFRINVGLDKIFDIRISKSEWRTIKIQKENAITNIEKTFRRTIDSYNSSIDLYKQYVKAKESNRNLFRSILNEYASNKTLDTQSLIRAIEWGLKFELGRNFAQHFFLVSRSQLERLLVKDEKYSVLIKMIPPRGSLHWWYDRLLLREDKAIWRDVENGEFEIENP